MEKGNAWDLPILNKKGNTNRIALSFYLSFITLWLDDP